MTIEVGFNLISGVLLRLGLFYSGHCEHESATARLIREPQLSFTSIVKARKPGRDAERNKKTRLGR